MGVRDWGLKHPQPTRLALCSGALLPGWIVHAASQLGESAGECLAWMMKLTRKQTVLIRLGLKSASCSCRSSCKVSREMEAGRWRQ
jgi:hypothetical protein